MSAQFEPIVGRYMHLDLFGRPHRHLCRGSGRGHAAICLHTAGSDGRQYRGLMNDARITAHHRVIAFDMPWHGKSSPPGGLARRGIPAHLGAIHDDDPGRS